MKYEARMTKNMTITNQSPIKQHRIFNIIKWKIWWFSCLFICSLCNIFAYG